MTRQLLAAVGDNPFGKIEPPAALEQGFGVIGSDTQPGLIGFISSLVMLITIAGGVWSLFNILFAGFKLITAEGDPKKIGEMSERIRNTFIGLLIMVAAPLLAGLIGLFFFGDATALLKPSITTPGGP